MTPPPNVPLASACIACEGRLTLFGPKGDYEYHVCSRCGTIQLNPQPLEEDLAEAYANAYSDAKHIEEFSNPDKWRRVSRRYNIALARTLRDHVPNGSVLDIGAGWGFLCELLTKEGYDCHGVELSRKMAAYARQNGCRVRQGELDVVDGLKGNISAIVMIAVFEHLVNHDAWLQRIHALLEDDGYFITLHPTAACYRLLGDLARLGKRKRELPALRGSFAGPWHTALFSLGAMRALGERNGFALREIRPAPQGRIGGVLSLIQIALDMSNRIGWALARERWPLVTTHIFVFQKLGTTANRQRLPHTASPL